MASSIFGAIVSALALLYALFIVVRTLIYGVDVPGYASLLVCVLFLGGVQLIGIGILGEYIGRIYSEVKRRPSYVVADRYRSAQEKGLPEGNAAPASGRPTPPSNGGERSDDIGDDDIGRLAAR